MLLLPEIFLATVLIGLLLILTFLTRRDFINKRSLNLNKLCWFFCFISVIFYFLLVLNTPPCFTLTFGIYSTHLLYTLKLFFIFVFALYLIYLWTEITNFIFFSYEFLIVLLFSFISLMLLLFSYSFINIFIFLEIFSLTIYYLIAAQRTSRSLESSIKYFIFGSITSIFLIFGFFLIYFSTGIGNFLDLELFSYNNTKLLQNPIYHFGCLVAALSLLAKIGGGFFFFWLVEVYDGASYPLLVFLNLFGKLIYIVILFNLLFSCNNLLVSSLIKLLLVSSLLFGAFGALYQTKTKRFIIYTSIYNISFFSIPFWHMEHNFKNSFLFFVLAYLVNSFILMILFSSIKDWNTGLVARNLSDLSCIKYQNKPLATVLVLFSFIASGLPPTALFLSKFFIFVEMSRTLNFVWLLFFLLASTFSFFYYIRLVKIILQPTKNITIFLKPLPVVLILLVMFVLFLNFFIFFFFDLFYYSFYFFL